MRCTLSLVPVALTLVGCSPGGGNAPGDNPFLADQSDDGKEDSAYMNPDGIEVEVDLEGDVEATASKIRLGPVTLGQYALTVMRKSETMYIESLAEQGTATDRSEWLIDGKWVPAEQVPAGATLKRWRLRGLNTVLLFSHATNAEEGSTFTAKVPVKPFTVFNDAGKTCADNDDHIALDQDVYWYRWEPEKSTCKIPMQDLQITISKKFPTTHSQVYPEYDQLIKDDKVTVVVMFGQIGEGQITNSDAGVTGAKRFGEFLTEAGYKSVTAPVGKRFEKMLSNDVLAQFDIYSPREFSGLGDYEHFDNFQKAISEHEVVVYDGHSMLGGSDFWSRPTYPSFYQIFLYGGCLGYEYYVQPILEGKGGSWRKLDLMSSVIEVTADANDFAAPAIAKLLNGVQNGGRGTWRQIMLKVRNSVGDSTFGVSGVRDNCFTPDGSRC